MIQHLKKREDIKMKYAYNGNLLEEEPEEVNGNLLDPSEINS